MNVICQVKSIEFENFFVYLEEEYIKLKLYHIDIDCLLVII